MSKAPFRPSAPVGPLVTDPAPPAADPVAVRTPPWLWPAAAAVALTPLVLTAAGLTAVAVRPAPPPNRDVAVVPFSGQPAAAAPAAETAPAPASIDPGEARPPLPGVPPRTAPAAEPAPEPVPADPPKTPRCDRFGTAIDFVRSPAVAFAQAGREGKLVLVLHLAGHFEDPGFTWNNAEALRAGALADETVGEYVGTHFVAAYQKVGTFRKAGDAKQGGNVAAYFCRTDGTVLHAVPGPVDAAAFLRAARWAVDVDGAATLEHPDDADSQRVYLKVVHGLRYLADRGSAPRATDGLPPAAKVNGLMPKSLPRGADRVAQAHWLLWSDPLPQLNAVYRTVWTNVLNEEVTDAPVRGR
jgi:hypothetical protein